MQTVFFRIVVSALNLMIRSLSVPKLTWYNKVPAIACYRFSDHEWRRANETERGKVLSFSYMPILTGACTTVIFLTQKDGVEEDGKSSSVKATKTFFTW